LACSIANALSRAGEEPSPLLYWAGILLIALPIFYRLTSEEASPGERLLLVCLLGLGLYGVKLVRDAPIFTFADEFLHGYNSNQISQHHHLFHANPILETSRYYPGLEGATSALRTLTGLSSYAAGAIVIGAARLLAMSAMFVLFWRVSDSARIAGIGTAIFTANFNFLFWSAQYSYQSMALPLLLLILLAVVELEVGPKAARGAWRTVAALAITAVVITHHITSYAVFSTLVVLSILSATVRRVPKPPNPWRFALLAGVLTTIWLVVVASSTVGYISPVITNAIDSSLHTATGEAPSRNLFQGSSSVVTPTPTIARGIALLAILLLVAGLPFGLRTVWRRYRTQPFALMFGLAAIGFFGALALRLAPAAWETGNRASEFLFIGLAFVLGCVGLERWRPEAAPWLGRTLTAAALTIVVIGGAIAGWPWDSQLAHAVKTSSEAGPTISSPPLAMAEWAKKQDSEWNYGAQTATSRMLLDPGDQKVYSDFEANLVEVIPATKIFPFQIALLREAHIRFVVIDRRAVAGDGIRGFFFSEGAPATSGRLPHAAVTKFEKVPGATRIYDSGSIVVYSIEPGRKDETLKP
jgi:energy-converting hydrogenase Eha subunit A